MLKKLRGEINKMDIEKIRQLLRDRITCVVDDLQGTDEDVNIHGELDEYKEGFKDALGWALDELNR